MRASKILYFDKPGPQNISYVVEAVKKRLRYSDIKYVRDNCMFSFGKTALKNR